MIKPYRLRLEYGQTKEGEICIIDGEQPMISWAVAAREGERQKAYRVWVCGGKQEDSGQCTAGSAAERQGEQAAECVCDTAAEQQAVCWDSGWVSTSAQNVRYAGAALEEGEVYTLTVCLRGEDGKESTAVSARLLRGSLQEWRGKWLCEQERKKDAVPVFVHDFILEKRVAAACLYVCGLGYHRTYLNGQPVFGEPLNPAASEYEKRAYYTVLPEMEKALHPGKNRIGIEVAGGWRTPDNVCYKLTGRIPDFTGEVEMSAVLRLRYEDGEIAWIGSDESWQYFYGEICRSNLFLGERWEMEARLPGWSDAGTALWQGEQGTAGPVLWPVKITEAPCKVLQPQTLEPIREQEIYPAQALWQVAEGVWSADFGQNIAGVCRLRIPRTISKGQVIELRHMEFLDEDGRLYLPQLRGADSIDTYVALGDGQDPPYWQPRFTYHGFRYAEITGYPEAMTREDIEAVSLYTDVAKGSHFVCGSALVNQICKNAVQTEKANLHSILTDCPQRDERMGWLNDATVRFEAAPYTFDIGRLFPKVVRDCLDVQDAEGAITCTAPFSFGARPADPVCSSFLIAGWQAYLHTGNTEIIKEGYEGFCRWNAFLEQHSRDGIVNYSYYGDWAAPAYACQSEEYAVSAVTPGELMSTGYYYYNEKLLAQMASLLGWNEKAAGHEEKSERIRQAFLREYWDAESGKVGSGSQGAQSFALWLDVLPSEGRQKAADWLHRDLAEREYRFTTGNLCTRYMMEVLTRYGYMEDAWKLAVREEYPSIGFMVQNEATTVWERFELKKNPLMNSHNHPMYGAVTYWYYGYLAGLKPLEGGWRRFAVRPYLPQSLLSANATVETPYGDVSVRWVRRYGEIHLYLEAPHGTSAEVSLPWGGSETVEAGFHHWSKTA